MGKGDEVGDPMPHADKDAPLISTDIELIPEDCSYINDSIANSVYDRVTPLSYLLSHI